MVTEKTYATTSGWTMLPVCLVGIVVVALLLIFGGVFQSVAMIVLGVLLGVAVFLSFCGLFAQQPGVARVMLLFGEYRGTVRANGFLWANPFVIRKPISLRLRNLEGSLLKGNDKQGN